MIVNINPYDTGYDENSHVMKFSAVTQSVHTSLNVVPEPSPHTVMEVVEGGKRGKVSICRMSILEGGQEEEVIYHGSLLLHPR